MDRVSLLWYLLAVAMLWLAAIKRLHDFGSSGWWSVLLLIPTLAGILEWILLLRRGVSEDE